MDKELATRRDFVLEAPRPDSIWCWTVFFWERFGSRSGGSMNCVCLSGPLSSGPWKSFCLVLSSFRPVVLCFAALLFCVFHLPLSRWCRMFWYLLDFWGALSPPYSFLGPLFCWLSAEAMCFRLGGRVWGLSCCVFLAFLRPSPCVFSFCSHTHTWDWAWSSDNPVGWSHLARGSLPAGRPERTPAMSSLAWLTLV